MAKCEQLESVRINRSVPTAAYWQLYRGIEREIRGSSLRSGDRLPTVAQMARQYKVSRTTIVRGLQELESRGLIISRWGAGTFVAEIPAPATDVLMHCAAPARRSTTTVFYDALLKALRKGYGEPDRRFSLSYVDGYTPSAREILGVASARHADSLVVYMPSSGRPEEDGLFEGIRTAAGHLPTVTLGRVVAASNADAVVFDPAPALRRMLEGRLAQGRRRFHFLGFAQLVEEASEHNPYASLRATFHAVLRDAGIEAGETIIEAPIDAAPKADAALPRLTDGATVVTAYPFAALADLDVRLDAIGYTEFDRTMRTFRDRVALLYLDLDRVGKAAAELTRTRKADGNHAPSRVVKIVPETIERR